MINFQYENPAKIIFGKGVIAKVGEEAKRYGAVKVLLVAGGGSIKRNGVYAQVVESLGKAGIDYCELWGIQPNPLLDKVEEGARICRSQGINFVLAVGGGSVIDSSKAIAYGVHYDGDVWDFWDGKAVPQQCLPVGTVLTIPAAGSEMSSSCVITKDDGLLKRGINSDLCRCKFAVMNPERTYTLPSYQTAAGGTDIMMHTMERYFSKYEEMTLTDGIAESLMRTVKDVLPLVLKDPENYRYRAQIMWAGSLAHNDLTECGTEKDFATHRLEHELSALFGVTHGAGLAALWPSWARFVMDRHLNRFVQFAVNVMGVTNDFANPRQTALSGIEAVEKFYHEIGMPTSIHELLGREITEEELEVMVDKCSRGGKITVGAMEVLGQNEMREIYRMAR